MNEPVSEEEVRRIIEAPALANNVAEAWASGAMRGLDVKNLIDNMSEADVRMLAFASIGILVSVIHEGELE